MEKRCIIHIPYIIDKKAKAAPMLRPTKMIAAFSAVGYQVDVISGDSKERKRLIAEVKARINSGVRYDFMYAESSTMPTILSDADHLPRHPWMDLDFFRFLHRKGIKIALFYRDMYWKFPLYRRAISLPKYVLGVSCYKRELRAYERYVDKFYLASSRCYPYFADTKLVTILDELPPGCENVINSPTAAPSEAAFPKPLTIFYVGGLGGHYKLDVLMAAVNVVPGIHLIVCCREKEWEKEKSSLEQYLSDRIAIIHKTSSELEPYYTSCDLCSALFANSAYMDMAMPYKLFEYLGNNKPVIATRDTAQGDFIEKTGAGWAIPCDLDATTELLRSLVQDPGKLLEKAELCTKAKLANTWEERAKKVIKDLL